MADVLQRCRRLGFPLLIKTNKKIGELNSVELLWLFYYLLEIYEPSWTHSPTAFTKTNYKPLSNAMRLLELAHKCPKSKELKRPFEYKRSITSSLGAVLDKLEGKFGANKLYSTRFLHPSIKGMHPKQDTKNKKNKINNNTKNKITNINHKNNNKINKNNKNDPKKCFKIPRATSYEHKTKETGEGIRINHHQEEKAMECDTNINTDISMNNYKECNLNAYDFKAPQCSNDTVQFHLKLNTNQAQLSYTQKYEELQRQQAEKMKNIKTMKQQYNNIKKELNIYYSFQAKSFQNTSSTDYASFQLESINQKLKSQQELKNHKSIQPMDQDDIDNLLTDLMNNINQ